MTKPLRTYTVEIYAPAYQGKPHPMQPSRRMRVHCGTFEQNRDSLNPGMILTREVHAPLLELAREQGREMLREYNRNFPPKTGGITGEKI